MTGRSLGSPTQIRPISFRRAVKDPREFLRVGGVLAKDRAQRLNGRELAIAPIRTMVARCSGVDGSGTP